MLIINKLRTDIVCTKLAQNYTKMSIFAAQNARNVQFFKFLNYQPIQTKGIYGQKTKRAAMHEAERTIATIC